MDAQTGMAVQFSKWGLIAPLDDVDKGDDDVAEESRSPVIKKRRVSSDAVVLNLGPAGSHISSVSSLNQSTVQLIASFC